MQAVTAAGHRHTPMLPKSASHCRMAASVKRVPLPEFTRTSAGWSTCTPHRNSRLACEEGACCSAHALPAAWCSHCCAQCALCMQEADAGTRSFLYSGQHIPPFYAFNPKLDVHRIVLRYRLGCNLFRKGQLITSMAAKTALLAVAAKMMSRLPYLSSLAGKRFSTAMRLEPVAIRGFSSEVCTFTPC